MNKFEAPEVEFIELDDEILTKENEGFSSTDQKT